MKRLSLLSGGEKSMTAIAFLFAVFLARPCPFYILDEVEAALDDLNIDRFLTLLRRHSSRAQFIVVTHQKRTMEAADWLYGVSMGGDGTSKVISRRLGEEGLDEVGAEVAVDAADGLRLAICSSSATAPARAVAAGRVRTASRSSAAAWCRRLRESLRSTRETLAGSGSRARWRPGTGRGWRRR